MGLPSSLSSVRVDADDAWPKIRVKDELDDNKSVVVRIRCRLASLRFSVRAAFDRISSNPESSCFRLLRLLHVVVGREGGARRREDRESVKVAGWQPSPLLRLKNVVKDRKIRRQETRRWHQY